MTKLAPAVAIKVASMVGSMALALWAGLAFAQDRVPDRGTQTPIPEDMWQRMQGVSWHADLPCPPRDGLRLLDIPYRDFQGRPQMGQLIVATSAAQDMLDIFADLHAAGFQIDLMRPVHLFLGDDGRSMAANNTSAFNCRVVGGTTRLSEHARGLAIDINPVQNPYVKGSYTSPSAGTAFDSMAERSTTTTPGVIRAGDAVVQAFATRGWGWGGDWSSSRDYQHFSQSGR